MKKPIYKLLILTLIGVMSLAATKLHAQTRPAPIDGSSIKMHTNKAIGAVYWIWLTLSGFYSCFLLHYFL